MGTGGTGVIQEDQVVKEARKMDFVFVLYMSLYYPVETMLPISSCLVQRRVTFACLRLCKGPYM